jgi:phosphoglycerate kinase
VKIRTLDDFDIKGKTVLLRVDMNVPIDPKTKQITGSKRIEDVAITVNALNGSKIVIISHQGRVGRDDFVGMENHAKELEKVCGKKVKYVCDVIGTHAQNEIKNMKNDEILLLDNLRMCAEENYEFTLEESAKTIMVQRLKDLFDLFVLDSFPSAHRTHPSLVGFAQVLPTCAGKLVEKEVKQLESILTVAKSPFVIILGGSKVDDRLKALKMLIEKERANHVLLTGIIANVFLRAQGRIKFPLGIKNEDRLVSEAHSLIGEYPDVFSTPVDIAVNKNDERIEIDVRDLNKDDQIFDVGQKTLDYYSKMIFGAGTVFISGPAGFFEKENFQFGTKSLLESVANSMATSIVSGGHLTFALKKYDLADKVNHVSTAGGALVRYITGQKLPMIKCLEDAANGNNSKD